MSSSFPPVTTHSLATTLLDAETLSDGELSPDSLFDELLLPPGTRTVIEVSPENENLTRTGAGPGVNQVMLFGRAGHDSGSSSAFPPFLNELLVATSELLAQHPTLPHETHAMLFPSAPHVPRARQAIINLYRPGEGIAPHVDLLRRFGDGIVGVSLGDGGVAMRFARAETRETSTGGGEDGDEYEVWLPSRSVLVLAGEARYEWTHGIAPCLRDKVEVIGGAGEGDASGWQWLERGIRVSVTFRWLLPGADVVGGDSISDDEEDH